MSSTSVLNDFVKAAPANSKLHRDRTWNWFTDDFTTRFNKDSALQRSARDVR
jgi:hypothetical protein